jgi:hypothetical protein
MVLQNPSISTKPNFTQRTCYESLIEQLGPEAVRIGLPGLIPPNDGGLATGQLAVALMEKSPTCA